MKDEYINLTLENIKNENLCCAIADKKHQCGVNLKKEWLKDRFGEGHVFRKLNQKGKVLIEYAPLETAWIPITGENYIYIYCLWVSGSFKGKGHANELLKYCISDAQTRGKSGVCIISSKKKMPFLSDKKFMQKFGFKTVDIIDDMYELLAFSFDGSKPHFNENSKKQAIQSKTLTIYYGVQCPYISNCIEQVDNYCKTNAIPLDLVKVDTLEKAKAVPCVFNNWAVFYNGNFKTIRLLNAAELKKMLEET